MPEAIPTSNQHHRGNDGQILAALSLLDDWSSFTTRVGAARFLQENPHFEDPGIQRIWQSVYSEKRPEVIAELLVTLGNLREQASDSVPIIAYHLRDEKQIVVEAATRALCSLSYHVEHAVIPLLSAKLKGGAEELREARVVGALAAGDRTFTEHLKHLDWIRRTPRHERIGWISKLPRIGIGNLPEEDRIRFLLLYADPMGDHVWGCLKVIWQSQKAVGGVLDQVTARVLSACKGSFCREVLSFREPIQTRFLAKALMQSRPFTASLAYPLGTCELDTAPAVELRVKAAAIQLSPQVCPRESLEGVLAGLWYEAEGTLRTGAIECLIDLMPNLGSEDARRVIDNVFEFLYNPVVMTRSVMREVASIITTASNVDIPYILTRTREILSSDAPKQSKISALSNLSYLQYNGAQDPLAHEAKTILAASSHAASRGISNVARVALTSLLCRERHLTRALRDAY